MKTLAAGQSVGVGERLDATNSAVALVPQPDSNLVLTRTDTGRAMWASSTVGSGATTLSMQTDGNLVLYRPGGHAFWAASPHDHTGVKFTLQGDGNGVIYAANGRPT